MLVFPHPARKGVAAARYTGLSHAENAAKVPPAVTEASRHESATASFGSRVDAGGDGPSVRSSH